MRVVDIRFIKGHGTANDFIILPEPLDGRELTAERIAWLCDRRMGIGADGVLRVARTVDVPDVRDATPIAPYFMDYRNADGSIAEMCGNGIRVFARYLTAAGLAEDDTFVVATRGGLMAVQVGSEEISVDLGVASDLASVQVEYRGRRWDGVSLHFPNPHAVAFVDDLSDFGHRLEQPVVHPAFADGVNVEFVERIGPGHLRMRVHERGVGETASCGTGACAVAWAAAMDDRTIHNWRVDVPGGTLWIDIDDHDHLHLRGPAVLVAKGTFQWPRELAGG